MESLPHGKDQERTEFQVDMLVRCQLRERNNWIYIPFVEGVRFVIIRIKDST